MQDKLKQAAVLISEVMSTLDVSSELCGHCKLPHYRNKKEAQLQIEMEAVVRKLLRWSTR